MLPLLPIILEEITPKNDDFLTLIGMRGDIFVSLSFLDQILSADYLSKLYKHFGGKN